jgi:hypothetical protein
MIDDEIDKIDLAVEREQAARREELRDRFAAAALKGIMARGSGWSAEGAAKLSWQMADAMLTERGR